jgi:hypothetical protein
MATISPQSQLVTLFNQVSSSQISSQNKANQMSFGLWVLFAVTNVLNVANWAVAGISSISAADQNIVSIVATGTTTLCSVIAAILISYSAFFTKQATDYATLLATICQVLTTTTYTTAEVLNLQMQASNIASLPMTSPVSSPPSLPSLPVFPPPAPSSSPSSPSSSSIAPVIAGPAVVLSKDLLDHLKSIGGGALITTSRNTYAIDSSSIQPSKSTVTTGTISLPQNIIKQLTLLPSGNYVATASSGGDAHSIDIPPATAPVATTTFASSSVGNAASITAEITTKKDLEENKT